ncbi:MAG TPA: ABC-2 family transporter protein, partial [Acidimicrobiales bacterium]|nr:ABC-2 family transporter protein [Acidimicrobiales bacterium]
ILSLDIAWTIGRLGAFAMMLAAGTSIFAAIWIIAGAFTFWLVEASEVMNSFTYGTAYATEYPMPVMTKWLRRFLTFVVPGAFIAYFPSLYILDKADPFGAPGWARFASPAAAFALLLVARTAWTQAIRHYRSTGS